MKVMSWTLAGAVSCLSTAERRPGGPLARQIDHPTELGELDNETNHGLMVRRWPVSSGLE